MAPGESLGPFRGWLNCRTAGCGTTVAAEGHDRADPVHSEEVQRSVKIGDPLEWQTEGVARNGGISSSMASFSSAADHLVGSGRSSTRRSRSVIWLQGHVLGLPQPVRGLVRRPEPRTTQRSLGTTGRPLSPLGTGVGSRSLHSPEDDSCRHDTSSGRRHQLLTSAALCQKGKRCARTRRDC